MKRIFYFCTVFLLGCSTLPPGEPPKGHIVQNPVEGNIVNFSQGRQQLATSFIAYTLMNLSAVDIQSDGASLSMYLLCEAGKVSGVKAAKKSEYKLSTMQTSKFLSAKLFHKSQLLWCKGVSIGDSK